MFEPRRVVFQTLRAFFRLTGHWAFASGMLKAFPCVLTDTVVGGNLANLRRNRIDHHTLPSDDASTLR